MRSRLCRCGTVCEGRCPKCSKHPAKLKTKDRGYGHDWRLMSERKRSIDPLCERCMAMGKTTAATEVHHIVPVAIASHFRLEPHNLMSVCHACHSELERGV